MKNKFGISILSVCVFIAASVSVFAQNTEPADNYKQDSTAIEQNQQNQVFNKGFYAGLSGSLASGICTFTSDKPGFQGNVFAGYRVSKLFSIEAGFGFGKLTMSARECCSNHPGINNDENSYWRSFVDNDWHVIPVKSDNGCWYSKLEGKTNYFKGVLQANFNVLSFLYNKEEFEEWMLEISPRMGFMSTKTTLTGPSTLSGLTESIDDSQTHFIWGGQASVAYNFKCGFGLGVYGAVDMLSGDNFDFIPEHVHNSNYIWDLGLKFTYTFWI